MMTLVFIEVGLVLLLAAIWLLDTAYDGINKGARKSRSAKRKAKRVVKTHRTTRPSKNGRKPSPPPAPKKKNDTPPKPVVSKSKKRRRRNKKNNPPFDIQSVCQTTQTTTIAS